MSLSRGERADALAHILTKIWLDLTPRLSKPLIAKQTVLLCHECRNVYKLTSILPRCRHYAKSQNLTWIVKIEGNYTYVPSSNLNPKLLSYSPNSPIQFNSSRHSDSLFKPIQVFLIHETPPLVHYSLETEAILRTCKPSLFFSET